MPGRRREERVPVHDTVPQDAAEKLDDADDLQHGVLQNLDEYRPHRLALTALRERRLTRIEVLVPCLRRGVLEPQIHHDPEGPHEDGRKEKHPPVLVDTASARAKHDTDKVAEPVEFSLNLLARGRHDGASEVEGEVDARRDDPPEDGGKIPAFLHVEPRCLRRDDGNRAVALKVHVYTVEEADQLHGGKFPSPHLLAVDDDTHEDVRHHGAEDADEHPRASADLVYERPGHEERETVDDGTPHEDVAELRLGHARLAERALSNGQIVPAEVERCVGERHGQPVDAAPEPKRPCQV